MAERTQIHVLINGRVQGVGFRAWIEQRAIDLGLTGWVRNRSDGSVEAVFQGEPERVGEMLEACKSGPRHAQVTSVELLGDGVDPHDRFVVLPTV